MGAVARGARADLHRRMDVGRGVFPVVALVTELGYRVRRGLELVLANLLMAEKTITRRCWAMDELVSSHFAVTLAGYAALFTYSGNSSLRRAHPWAEKKNKENCQRKYCTRKIAPPPRHFRLSFPLQGIRPRYIISGLFYVKNGHRVYTKLSLTVLYHFGAVIPARIFLLRIKTVPDSP